MLKFHIKFLDAGQGSLELERMWSILSPMEEYHDVLNRPEMWKVSLSKLDVYKRKKLFQMCTKGHSQAFDEVISGWAEGYLGLKFFVFFFSFYISPH